MGRSRLPTLDAALGDDPSYIVYRTKHNVDDGVPILLFLSHYMMRPPCDSIVINAILGCGPLVHPPNDYQTLFRVSTAPEK